MKKFFVPTFCVLVGCAAGAAMPTITAQSFAAPSPATPRWEQFCEENGSRGGMNAALVANAAARGREGFELVGVTTGWNTLMACYKRPAQ